MGKAPKRIPWFSDSSISSVLGGRYKRQHKLGEGGQGKVHLALDTWCANSPVVIKRVHDSAKDILAQEFQVLQQLHHPAFVAARDFVIHQQKAYLVEEYVEGLSLWEWSSGRPPSEVIRVILPVLHALLHLHVRGFVHGDVQPRNILIRQTLPIQAVLVDLGLARSLGTTGVSGTPGFIAPEVLKATPVGAAADVFSIAMTLISAITQQIPNLESFRNIEARWPEVLPRFLIYALRSEPQSRPDLRELLRFLAQQVEADIQLFQYPLGQVPLCGRDAECEAFRQWLNSEASLWAICGASGSGKSALLKACHDQAKIAGYHIIEINPLTHDVFEQLHEIACSHLSELSEDFHEATFQSAGVDAPFTNQKRINKICTATEKAQNMVLTLDRIHTKRPLLLSIDNSQHAQDALASFIDICTNREKENAFRLILLKNAMPEAEKKNGEVVLGPLTDRNIKHLLRFSLAYDPSDAEYTHIVNICGRWPKSICHALSYAASEQKHILEIRAQDLEAVNIIALPRALYLLAGFSSVFSQKLFNEIVVNIPDGSLCLQKALQNGSIVMISRVSDVCYCVPEGIRQSVLPLLEISDFQRLASYVEVSDQRIWAAPLYASAKQNEQAVAILNITLEQTNDTWYQAVYHTMKILGPENMPLELLQTWAQYASQVGALSNLNEMCSFLSEANPAWIPERYIAQAQIKAGDYQAALDTTKSLFDSVAVTSIRARALYFSGRVEEAYMLAQTHWKEAQTEDRLALLDILGHCAFALGKSESAQSFLKKAIQEAQVQNDQGAICRAQHGLAIVEHRLGHLRTALKLYRSSLRETHHLASITRTLNLATVLQDCGEYLEAFDLYLQTWSQAMALANHREQTRVGVNLANLQLQMGLLHEAQRYAIKTLDLSRKHKLHHATLMALMVLTEIYIEWERPIEAENTLLQAKSLLDAIEDQDAFCEWQLLRIRILGLKSDVSEAFKQLDNIQCRTDAFYLKQQLVFWRLYFGVYFQVDLGQEYLGLAEQMTQTIKPEQSRLFIWRANALGYCVLMQFDKTSGAKDMLQRARAEIERFLKPLPAAWQKSYLCVAFNQRLYQWIFQNEVEVISENQMNNSMNMQSRAYRKLLAINRRLARKRDVESLLEIIVDTAIELLGAERGFLLLKETSGVRIAVARNFDQQSLEDGRQRISRSIANECLQQGEPILTTNAQKDQRFMDIASVTSLKVRSVICAPLRGMSRHEDPLIGVLYLDHRYQEKAFNERDVDLGASFADQAAIAIENARLLKQTREQEQKLAQQNEHLATLNVQLKKEVAAHAAEAEEALRRLREDGPTVGVGKGFERIVGQSDILKAALRLVDRFADTDIPIFVSGESGTGKELIARAIHERSGRQGKPFISVNCAAIPETLIESELFGYRQGAFTGATRDKPGLITAAHGGTLFLDEIGEMSVNVQAKLLRVLQEKEYCPVGDTQSRSIALRVISASHQDLEVLIKANRFREDLFYRLRVVEIHLPALRERREDIPMLTDHFCRQLIDKPAVNCFAEEALTKLMGYDWPGNIRELENEIRRALALSDGLIQVLDLSERVQAVVSNRSQFLADMSRGSLKDIMDGFEREVLLATLKRGGWNVKRCAKDLGLSRAALYTRLNKFGITRDDRAN